MDITPHTRRTNIDWVRMTPYDSPEMLSWDVEPCDCLTPWSHY